jgi:DNA-binding transcriptional regulator YdaS (Cro superfamily)
MKDDLGLAKAIEAAGSKRELARKLGVDSAAVVRWRRVPYERLLQVEEAVSVPRHVLRPELFKGYARVL